MTINTNNGIDTAPEEIKLAVDLIYLLESNEVNPAVALQAINIVKRDLEKRVGLMGDSSA
ncbi:pleiotropic regulatory protein RsmS [Vibrio sp. VB16]|uniref:pleiotropic regulatory protein RsmS n=1 Tax=Vibrio sp. VB16 TaxID=2785746 RepID=UPI00189DFE21|nr:pleiotropic regulatory protein RsmS [Vibrio sp. VB16]UGA53785.1 pleiotropic regulatory protein RsmS [Vibrio sp. VB16]